MLDAADMLNASEGSLKKQHTWDMLAHLAANLQQVCLHIRE